MKIDLNKLRRSRMYQNTTTPLSLCKDLRHLAEIDDLYQKQESHARKMSNIGCLVVILALITTFIVTQSFLVSGFFAFILFTLCVWGAGVAIVYYFKANNKQRLNFSTVSYRYRILEYLNKLLRKDINPDSKLKVTLGLSPVNEHKKIVKQSKHPSRYQGQIRFYQDNWLSLQGEFIDKTIFILQIRQYCQLHSWKNARGKSKSKIKHKGFVVVLILKPLPSSKYDILLADKKLNILQFIKIPPTVNLQKLYFKKYKLGIVAKVPFQVDLLQHTIIMMFLSGFQILNLPAVSESKKAS